MQNRELTQIKESVQPLKERNEQTEEIISSITTSLKDAKLCLEKEMKYSGELQDEKVKSAEHAKKMADSHKYEIGSYKKWMEEAHEAQARLRTEMDGLRKQLCEEQLDNTKLNLVENNLKVVQESIARLNAEKSDLCEEAANVKRENEALVEEMEKASADPLKMLQKELEGLKSKIADARVENEEMIGLQGEYLCIICIRHTCCTYKYKITCIQ